MPSPVSFVVKKRLEQPLADLRRHPDAAVANEQHHVWSGNHIEIVGAELDVARLDVKGAATGHRIAGIDHEVHQHLADLGGIGVNGREVWRQRDLETNLRANEAPDKIFHVRDHHVEFNGPRHPDLTPAERQQLLR